MSAQRVFLGVEISQNGLKVALVEPKRKKILKIDSLPTSGNSIHDASIYASVISSWVRSKLLPKVEAVAIAFPADSCIMRAIAIPKEAKNISTYVKWEFETAINSQSSDYKINTFFFPNLKKPENAVVSALRRDVIDSFCAAELEKSGFKPSYLMVDLFTLFNLLECSEGLSSSVKCVLKADEKFATAFWANKNGFLSIRLLPKDCISKESVVNILESGFAEFPKAKRKVKFCGELTENAGFAESLAACAKKLKKPIEITPWNSVSKFSLEKNENFSKLPQCLSAVGATLSCI